jgi:hypothetical protein
MFGRIPYVRDWSNFRKIGHIRARSFASTEREWCRGACPHAQDQIAAEDSRLYTRTDRSDEAGSGNLSELALDVSEKRGTVSPFQQFTFSSIIQAFLKINMNIQTLYRPKTTRCCSHGAVRRPSPVVPDGANAPQGRGYNIRQTSSKILCPLIFATLLGMIPNLAIAQLANINPIKDNTLYQYDPAEGDVSNALGQHFFAGETGMGELRRGVLAFDIAGSVPVGSTILGVTLSLNMSRTGSATPRMIELHKMLGDWGEGTSVAPGEEGDGAPATTNDATWRHRFFDTIFWTTEGGDFSATVSGSQSVGAVGMYTWSSSQMRADVQSWLNDPASNFGWLVLGDESEIATAKRFDTRESANPPVLTIIYRPAGPRPTPTPRPRATPSSRPTPSAFSHPSLFLSRLFALLPTAQSTLPAGD